MSELTGSYNHPLGSFCVHRQRVYIEPCSETVRLKDRFYDVETLNLDPSGFTHFNERDHGIGEGRNGSGRVLTIGFSTASYFSYICGGKNNNMIQKSICVWIISSLQTKSQTSLIKFMVCSLKLHSNIKYIK